jgi:hypothetical protein
MITGRMAQSKISAALAAANFIIGTAKIASTRATFLLGYIDGLGRLASAGERASGTL